METKTVPVLAYVGPDAEVMFLRTWLEESGITCTELALTPEQIAELDRRFAEHQANPDSARSWTDVEKNLRDHR